MALTEHQEQCSFFAAARMWMRERGDVFPIFAIPNGGLRDTVTGRRLKDEGVLPGVPDIFAARPSRGRHGLFIEMKTATGRPSPLQVQMMAALDAMGYSCVVAHGWRDAMEALKEYVNSDDCQV